MAKSSNSTTAGQPDGARPVAVVTGGAKRVGSVVARHLAASGYLVVIHANRSLDEAKAIAGEIESQGGHALATSCDLADEARARAMFRQLHADLKRIDALVNCAAIWKPKPLEEIRAADVREHFEVNTLGTFVCCQEAGLIMASQPTGGAIVNVCDWAIVRPYVDYAAYFPSKGAIPTLTRTLAVELARRNPRVRVNAILPGPVLLAPDISDEERRAVIDSTLVKHEGTPQHVAHAVQFLLENDFVTGVCLPVDGGRSIFAGHFERGN